MRPKKVLNQLKRLRLGKKSWPRLQTCLMIALSLAACQTLSPQARKQSRSSCPKPLGSDLRLVGGSLDRTKFPATVIIGAFDARENLLGSCTASFVRDDLLLSAAHCVDPSSDGTVTSVAFAYDSEQLKNGGIERSKTWVAHPSYRSTTAVSDGLKNDILLVSFPPATYRGQPARLSLRAPSPRQSITLVGYGAASIDPNNVDNYDDSRDRRVGNNIIQEIQRNSGDAIYWSRSFTVRSDGEPAGVNHGDSGGPVYNSQGELVGIIQSLGIREDFRRQKTLESWAINLQYQPVRSFIEAQLKAAPKLPPKQVQQPLSENSREGQEKNADSSGC